MIHLRKICYNTKISIEDLRLKTWIQELRLYNDI